MSGRITRLVVLVAALLTVPGVPSRADAEGVTGARPGGQASATDAAPFLGDWTLALEGPNGPATFTLSVKTDKEKVSAELVGPTDTPQAITDISKADKALLLRYSFMYEGNPIDAVIRLTPAADAKMDAQIDFAGGAYIMSGTATRKEKAK